MELFFFNITLFSCEKITNTSFTQVNKILLNSIFWFDQFDEDEDEEALSEDLLDAKRNN